MAANNETPSGLEANTWTDPDTIAPDCVQELLEIPRVERVTKKSYGIVTVDTPIWFDEDGFAEPHPELLSRLTAVDGMSLGGWSIQKVTVKEDGNDSMLRIQLSASTPTCDAEDCHMPAEGKVHGVVLDGEKFEVLTCGRHH